MARIDVTIRGAGIFGLSCAWACVLRGARVRVIDPYGPGAGSSGGLVGALAPHVPENWNDKKAFQLDSLLMAKSWWAQIEAASNLPSGYGRLGRVQPLNDARAVDLARGREITARALWGDAARWQVTDIPSALGTALGEALGGALSDGLGAKLLEADGVNGHHLGDAVAPTGDLTPVSPTGYYVFDTLSARMHPRLACASLAEAVQVRGGEIVTSGALEGAVIHATGLAGLEEMGAEAGRMIGVGVKGQAALLDFDARGQPQVFAGGVHVVPHADGTTAIGSTSERDYTDHDRVDGQLNDVITAARHAVPALADALVIERWAGVRPRARSRAPMLGAYPGRAGHFIANGGFKIGFGMAPKVGQVMADLVLDGRDAIPEGFRAAALWP